VAQIPDEGAAADHDDEKNDDEEHSEEGFHAKVIIVFIAGIQLEKWLFVATDGVLERQILTTTGAQRR
jgi:hypothetical protein